MTERTIGIDVGGTNVRFGLFAGPECLESHREEVDLRLRCSQTTDVDAARTLVLDVLEQGIRVLMARASEPMAVGVAVPGFVTAGGVLLLSPNIPHMESFALQEALTARLACPVLVENDANAAAYGEYWRVHQERPEVSDLLYLGLGTGVGGGWIVRGQPWRGRHGSAMELGHLIVVPGGRRCGCGNQGCLEQYASAQGLISSYVELTGTAPDGEAIAHLARMGRAEALQVFQILGDSLGQVIAHVAKTLDPGLVRIGGGLSAAWDCFAGALQSRLDADLIPVLRGQLIVEPGNADDLAGMRGAALLALDQGCGQHR